MQKEDWSQGGHKLLCPLLARARGLPLEPEEARMYSVQVGVGYMVSIFHPYGDVVELEEARTYRV